MDIVKKFFRGVGGVIHIVTGTVFSYLGILSNILGTIMGILASLMTIGIIAGICVLCQCASNVYRSKRSSL